MWSYCCRGRQFYKTQIPFFSRPFKLEMEPIDLNFQNSAPVNGVISRKGLTADLHREGDSSSLAEGAG